MTREKTASENNIEFHLNEISGNNLSNDICKGINESNNVKWIFKSCHDFHMGDMLSSACVFHKP